jgi:hypothetical protein
VPLALSPYTQVTNVPVIPDQTHSKTCCNPPSSPKTAVFSIPPRVREESCAHRSDGVELAQNYDTCCSAREMVSDRWGTHVASSPKVQTRRLPCSPQTTHSRVHVETLHGPSVAVSSIHGRLPVDSYHRGLDGVKPWQNYEIFCSAKENVSKLRTVPQALSPYTQVTSLPVTREPMHLEMRICHFYGPKKAVSSNILRFHRRTRCRVLDVSRRRRSNIVSVKRSTVNVVPKTNPRCSFTQPQDWGKIIANVRK